MFIYYERIGEISNSMYKKLKTEICKYDVISFDIFDTIFIRLVDQPKDIFRLMGKRCHT